MIYFKVGLKTPNQIKLLKTKLELSNKLNKSLKIVKDDTNLFYIPTLYQNKDQLTQDLKEFIGLVITEYEDDFLNESDPLKSFISNYLLRYPDVSNKVELLDLIPKKYTLYPPMMLINNQNTFDSPQWVKFLSNIDATNFFQNLLAFCFKDITHIAINKPIIEQDIMRRPFNLVPIHGDFGPEPTEQSYDNPTEEDFQKAFWCSALQNGIYQTWAPRYTMFSRGNIKEKTRILNNFKRIDQKVVIDMYAGIGYFTLSYLKKNAANLICFELNPWSIKGLTKGLEKNKYTYKVIKHEDEITEVDPNIKVLIFHESNEFIIDRLAKLKKVFPITHINLGLLPSSKPAWSLAVSAFERYSIESKCEIHIHENLKVQELDGFLGAACTELETTPVRSDLSIRPIHLEKIKTFAPDVWHICADIEISKVINSI
ncbi:hypothetical protein WICMUC_005196 [Wickerhamomyces mucosus]|uniref:tRNA wybutosine-synthesizing protein 2 n=1 Tax=Wickerhamomyces mucosus TaxID=1378264 RepID=A0A9P8P9U2_9ASCO|nr:hypothetical protein WICMUC_005196 [Wickerhamomyces mucosus]